MIYAFVRFIRPRRWRPTPIRKLTVDNGLSKVYLLLSQQANGQYDIDAVTHPWRHRALESIFPH